MARFDVAADQAGRGGEVDGGLGDAALEDVTASVPTTISAAPPIDASSGGASNSTVCQIIANTTWM